MEKIGRANKIYKGLRADPHFLTARIVRSLKFLLTAHRSPTNLTCPVAVKQMATSIMLLAPASAVVASTVPARVPTLPTGLGLLLSGSVLHSQLC